MKIFLLIPPTDLSRSYGELKSYGNPQPSLGIAYIASVLREDGHQVKVTDAYVGENSLSEIMVEIEAFRPEFLGISVLSPSADIVFQIVREVRKNLSSIQIILGNLHASIFADEILADNLADFIVHHEGEITARELIRTLEIGEDPRNVQGISLIRDGKVVHTPKRPLMKNLDVLPFPAWDLFPLKSYQTDPRSEVKRGHSERHILATRGCPNQCTFCSARTEKSLGMEYRMRDPKKVVDELEFMNEKFGSEIFAFMDLAFPLVKKHAIEFCKEMIRRGLQKKFRWFSECRVKPLDQETMEYMKEAGCVRICLGVESGNDRILKSIKKNFTVKDVARAVKLATKIKLDVDGMFMLGLPGEGKSEIIDTINLSIRLPFRFAIFNLFVPYPGCELFDELSTAGKIHYKSWGEFTAYPTFGGGQPVYVPDSLTQKELTDLQKKAMITFYLRPRFVMGEIRRFKFGQFNNYYIGLKAMIKTFLKRG